MIRKQKTKAGQQSVTSWPRKNYHLAVCTGNWAVDAGLDAEGLPRALRGSDGGLAVSVTYRTAYVLVYTLFLGERNVPHPFNQFACAVLEEILRWPSSCGLQRERSCIPECIQNFIYIFLT